MPVDAAKPGQARALAFSAYSGRIAYLDVNPMNQPELWLSDFQGTSSDKVWVDTSGQTKYGGPYDLLFLRWIIRDQFVLIRNVRANATNPDNGVVHLAYGVKVQRIIEFDGECSHLMISPVSYDFAVACPVDNQRFVVLEQDGTSWETDALAGEIRPVQNFAFAADSKQVVFSDFGNAIFVWQKGRQPLQLPVRYPDMVTDEKLPLQWSLDGLKVLVYGSDLPGTEQYCVLDPSTGRVNPCWQLFTPTTGERLWYLSQVSDDYAALSPDGRWLATNHVDIGVVPIERLFMVYDTSRLNSGVGIMIWTVDAFAWGK
jgi:hypothetical protein